MKLKLFTFRFSESSGGFDDGTVQKFIEDKEVIECTNHFFVHEKTPYLTVILSYRDISHDDPKKIRFSLSNRIADLALNIIEGIIEARYSKEKGEILHKIDLNMEKLQVILRICHDLKYLDHKGYELASKKIHEAGKMVGGWRKYQERKGV